MKITISIKRASFDESLFLSLLTPHLSAKKTISLYKREWEAFAALLHSFSCA